MKIGMRFNIQPEVPPILVAKEFIGADVDIWVQIIAIEVYPNSIPTFTVLSKSGHIFAYIPPQALICHDNWQLNRADYYVDIECPNSPCSVSQLNIIGGGWGRIGTRIISWARYLCSVDWPEENILLHWVLLTDGSFAVIRNSRFQIGGIDWNPPTWKKMREEWHLEEHGNNN